jgi:hypothetical protein
MMLSYELLSAAKNYIKKHSSKHEYMWLAEQDPVLQEKKGSYLRNADGVQRINLANFSSIFIYRAVCIFSLQ